MLGMMNAENGEYFNRGHIFTFIVNENIECEDPEVGVMETQTTVKPSKRDYRYVDSNHISEIQDAQEDNYYICQCECPASFQIFIKNNITVIINRTSGEIIKGTFVCFGKMQSCYCTVDFYL
ncbi:hypothetical protein JTB14_000297 [Gonioctena quinquepunctata]|nr:hypothetical protein JTB14_000297 [Gonioctena quinquepunctata]